MNKNDYKECYRLSKSESAWLTYYRYACCDDTQTKSEERRYESIGCKYTNDDNWYYKWDREEQHWYVVVDLED